MGATGGKNKYRQNVRHRNIFLNSMRQYAINGHISLAA